MDVFKKRGTAVAVFVLVVIVFSLIGCHLSLGRACSRAEDAFFDKEKLTGYGCYTSPGDQLAECVKYANRLLSVINGSDELTEDYAAIRDGGQALSAALEERDISDIYDANAALYAAVSAADEKVRAGAALAESSDDYNTIVSDFFSAERVVENAPYNQYIDDFIEDTVKPFPTNILRRLAFVSLPEKYE